MVGAMPQCRTFRYLLQPTTRQRADFERLLALQCELYNAALEARKGAWEKERRSVSYISDCATLTETRAVRPDLFEFGVTVCRGTLKRLDRAYRAFYRRCRAAETPGYPRFKSPSRFDSVQREHTKSWALDTEAKRLRVQGIGGIKVRLHRPLRGTPKAITIKREDGAGGSASAVSMSNLSPCLRPVGRSASTWGSVPWSRPATGSWSPRDASGPGRRSASARARNGPSRPRSGDRGTDGGPPKRSGGPIARCSTSARIWPTSSPGAWSTTTT